MLIKAISKTYPDGRMGTGVFTQLKGKFKGYTINIDSFGNKKQGIKAKQYTIDGPNYQRIVNKVKNEKGRFEVLG